MHVCLCSLRQSSAHTKGQGHYVIKCHQQPQSLHRKANEDLLADHSLQWDHQVSQPSMQNKLPEVPLLAGQLSFLARASIHDLPTPTSLARWNMKVPPSCPLCQQAACTTKHVLSCCKTALNQGRYTWRHDRALLITAEFIKHHRADASVYCVLPGFRATDNLPSIIPPETLPPLPGLTLSSSQLAASTWWN